MLRACALVFLLSLCAKAHAEEACPWLTKGTVAALMGGDVSVAVHVLAGEGTCDFLRDANGGSNGPAPGDGLHLRIAVSPLPPKECATGERLTGIGEDSVLCSMDVEGTHREMIRGRVRDKYVLVTLSIAKKNPAYDASLRQMLERATEEVAGNLF